jgi:hypothetical protein
MSLSFWWQWVLRSRFLGFDSVWFDRYQHFRETCCFHLPAHRWRQQTALKCWYLYTITYGNKNASSSFNDADLRVSLESYQLLFSTHMQHSFAGRKWRNMEFIYWTICHHFPQNNQHLYRHPLKVNGTSISTQQKHIHNDWIHKMATSRNNCAISLQ